MITGYFRESEGGALHDVQSMGARALEPFQIGAARLVLPFRDAWGWFDGLIDAKSENEKLRSQVDEYRAALVEARSRPGPAPDVTDATRVAAAPRYPDFRLLAADVIFDVVGYQQQIVISAGSRDGVHRYDPVIARRGKVLVGHVSKVAASTARVTLITDRTSAVSAYVLERRAKGSVRGRGPQHSTVYLDRVPKQEVVRLGDDVVTAGRLSGENYPSFYPRGIAIGKVTAVHQSDTHTFKLVHVTPYADLSGLDRVVVLLPRKPLPVLP
ncbi:MAG: rod shape-determining protein MreC [Actinomycetota bacterium]|nr:rod shape-determining protein MreC [Actinomycetota bacterium]